MILIVSSVNAEKYFVLDVNYILDYVTYNKISLREIDRPVKADTSGFLIKAVSFKGEDLKKLYYNMSENKNYLIYIPYDKNTARIEVYDLQNSKIIDLDVTSFSDTCGNKICEPYESYESCTNDCASGSKDDFCDGIDDGICDPDCTISYDADCASPEEKINITPITTTKTEEAKPQQKIKPAIKEKKEPNYLMWVLLSLAIIIPILLFTLLKQRREKKIIESLKQYIIESISKGFSLQQIKNILYREGYTQKEIDKAIKSIGS